MNRVKKQNGTTLVELLLVMAIVGVFVQLVMPNFFRSQQRSSLGQAKEGFIRDVRTHQLAAQSGKTSASGASTVYSVRIEAHRYVLFEGDTFVASDPSNTVVALDSILALSTTIPNQTLTFSRISGDVVGYEAGSDTVTITNTQTGDSVIMQINRRGVIITL